MGKQPAQPEQTEQTAPRLTFAQQMAKLAAIWISVGAVALFGYVNLVAYETAAAVTSALVVVGGAALGLRVTGGTIVYLSHTWQELQRDRLETAERRMRVQFGQAQITQITDGAAYLSRIGDAHFAPRELPAQVIAPDRVITLEQRTGTGYNAKRLHISEEDYARLAELAPHYRRRGLSIAQWTGKDKPFGRTEYEAFLQRMQKAGVIAWINAQQPGKGRRLTEAGAQLLDSLKE